MGGRAQVPATDEQGVEGQRGEHRGDDGQGDAAPEGVATQQWLDHERVTLAVNR